MKLDLAVLFSSNISRVFHLDQEFALQALQRRADFAGAVEVGIGDRHQFTHSPFSTFPGYSSRGRSPMRHPTLLMQSAKAVVYLIEAILNPTSKSSPGIGWIRATPRVSPSKIGRAASASRRG